MPPDSPRNALLVGIRVPPMSEKDCTDSLTELGRLADTLGHTILGTLIQARPNLNGPTVVGEGKLKELARLTGGRGVVASPVKRQKTKAELRREEEPPESKDSDEKDQKDEEPPGRATLVIFDCELTPSQMQKLQSATGVPVLDRNAVIIQIFSRHARTRAARLQVELAELAYLSPRLREAGGGDRQAGGIGAKGVGETRLELDRRRIRDRMKELRDELDGLAGEDSRRRERRAQEPTVALVGYTNAGKSSLMHALTGSAVLVQDKLFATLDTTVRPVHPETRPRILISDTVGFIQKLPHDLVASFRSTLAEALQASLLLLVVDASDPAFRHQLAVTRSVLAEIHAGDIPGLLLLNKIDRVPEAEREALSREFPGAILLCALDADHVKRLRDTLVEFFEKDMVERAFFVPYTSPATIGSIHQAARVLAEEYSPEGVTLRVKAHPRTLDRIFALTRP